MWVCFLEGDVAELCALLKGKILRKPALFVL